ncbi:zinc finger protein schnurri isoform X1 [Rhynchophorus ferrugineus]|uniref:zinc finger protein schnurri isoform X1 n=2 Tax=Rhynchophorus ferrugineus TaxID=354439 RepID=UPI003FCDBABD
MVTTVMDVGIDNYLHKKFKKQLSIDPRPQNDKENKDSTRNLEPGPEKATGDDHTAPHPAAPTNLHTPVSKSSISAEPRSISSYVEPTNPDHPIKSVTGASSVDDLTCYRRNSATPPPPSAVDDHDASKPEDVPVAADKSSGGKYVCTYCNLVCSKPSVLQKHIRAHTNERPYPCTSCGFSFKTRSNLYKHCRSRTHANRVMGNKAQEEIGDGHKQNFLNTSTQTANQESSEHLNFKTKPYKPRFHTVKQFTEKDQAEEAERYSGNDLSHHINEIISKNNSIVNSGEHGLYKKRYPEPIDTVNNNEYIQHVHVRNDAAYGPENTRTDEPLNLTNKNRKRSMSELAEPVIQKSLIKELLLKNLSSDMQCPYCKMIFQTVTELELHKLRSCKGKPSDAKYTRSSSVNVASILTKNKNAFDSMPQFQNRVFPLNSPGPFLGKTRLVESDKSKSFSFDAVNIPIPSPGGEVSSRSPSFVLSPLHFAEEKKTVKLFGGQVKVHSGSDSKSFRIDNKDDKQELEGNFADYSSKLSENRVVKSGLQSGGTVLTNQTSKEEPRVYRDVIRVYENTSVSPNIDMTNLGKPHFNYEKREEKISISEPPLRPPLGDGPTVKNNLISPSHKYNNITDFSQNAVKLLTPNIKQPTISLSGMFAAKTSLPYNVKQVDPDPSMAFHSPRQRACPEDVVMPATENEIDLKLPPQPKKRSFQKPLELHSPGNNIYKPVNLLVNGKVVRYVPGIPGPVAADGPVEMLYGNNIIAVAPTQKDISSPVITLFPQPQLPPPDKAITPKPSPTVQKTFPYTDKLAEKSFHSRAEPAGCKSESRSSFSERRSPLKLPDQKSPSKDLKIQASETSNEPKKFVRPNSLALKPTSASLKQHHGLTPTIFNQILISPDTPRVDKKYAQQFLNGNYFTYLGLKSSTKPVYCTLNKTQPFYVPHFKKLSMYSEWRQQDTKTDKLYVSSYDSRQKNLRYTTAGKTFANFIIHSSYKFVVSEVSSRSEKSDDGQKPVIGGYESTEDSPYVRGRGRGRYVCEQCGIRCKKPSMLKKHIRTHSNDRPYTCSHCNFSFKTKGNLTKHMKSKSHSKNLTDGESGPSTQLNTSQSSGSDTDDSGMDSSDESMTRQQEHEAAYGLLSLSQKTTSISTSVTEILSPSGILQTGNSPSNNDQIMTTEEIAYVSKTNYAKNKFLDNLNYKPCKEIAENISMTEKSSQEEESVSTYLGKTTTTRPLTYPYTSSLSVDGKSKDVHSPVTDEPKRPSSTDRTELSEPKNIKTFHVIQKYAAAVTAAPSTSPTVHSPRHVFQESVERNVIVKTPPHPPNNGKFQNSPVPTLKVNDMVFQDSSLERKRKISFMENSFKTKIHRNDEVMDLSMASAEKRDVLPSSPAVPESSGYVPYEGVKTNQHIYVGSQDLFNRSSQPYNTLEDEQRMVEENNYKNKELSQKKQQQRAVIFKLSLPEPPPTHYNYSDAEMHNTSSSDTPRLVEYDNSAMETLADVATKQVKLEKNMSAKSVATEYLKLVTQNDGAEGGRDIGLGLSKDVNDLLVKPEGNKSCSICSKSFNKPSQLRLHMNIHYLERPFRCDSCSVSFRTKGHLQKHERSASHYSKLSSSPAQSSSEPRPFKCSDCNIAFRIHGHLAKHLRSKMHIMKLECLDKIPFGLYAELERSNSLLTEINTSDVDQCLESLKTLAKKVFINDPNKLQSLYNHVESGSNIDV